MAKANTKSIMNKKLKADPVFALIEKHRSAVIAWQKPLLDVSNADAGTAAYKRFEKIESVALDAVESTAEALSEVIPNSMAGILALLDHIENVNTDRIIPPAMKKTLGAGCATDFNEWPDWEKCPHPNARGRSETWSFRVMRNIATALKAIEANKSSENFRKAA